MRVVIVGAGAVGSYLAERLSLEGQDVVVIESDPRRATEVQEQIDCLVISGNGASLESLSAAGVDRADLFIAVSSSDAVNVLACHAATRLGSARRIARVEDPQLRDEAEQLGVDLLIDPGEATARDLLLLVQQRGVSELIEFADGRIDLIGGFITAEAPVAGLSLAELRRKVSGWSWLIAAVIRDGETMIARGSTRILPGDHVLFMTETNRSEEPFRLLGIHESPSKKVAVFGATRLAGLTAEVLCEAGIATMLVDQDRERVRRIATSIPRVVGVHGDPTNPRMMRAEGIDTADAVLALTGWDEVNILGCLVAKAVGVPTAVARFHRTELVRLLAGVGIDAGVSSRLSAASEILRFVRRGRIHSVVTFQDSDAEALEIEVGGSSHAAGKTLRDLHLSHEAIVGGVIRGAEAFVPRGDSTIEVGDRLIVIALPSAIHEAEQLGG
jgi:trk system potassium uptake protein TrkA